MRGERKIWGFFNFKEKRTTYKLVVVEKKYTYWVIV